MTNQALLGALRDLAFCEKTTIECGESRREIAPQKRSSLRNKVENFDYEKLSHSSHSESFVELSWSSSIQRIVETVKKTREYASALEYVEEAVGKEDSSRYLDFFVERLAKEMLENSANRLAKIDDTIETFVKDLLGRPLSYYAEAKLDGLMLRPNCIEIDSTTVLRRTAPQDIEKESALFIAIALSGQGMPSAILGIEFLTRGGSEIHEAINRAITILRLFRAGSVRLLRSSYYSCSVTDKTVGSMNLGNKYEVTLWRYWISESDIEALKGFWQMMASLVPILVAPTEELTFTATAYNHYSIALLRSASTQSLIAEAVKGLEAIFTSNSEKGFLYRVSEIVALLKHDEIGRVIHHLRERIGRTLEPLGMESQYVRNVVNDAYAVRSSESHGRVLDSRKKRRIMGRYGSFENLLKLVLDYLRICLVAALLHGKTKEEFLDLIDCSSIDSKKRETLNSMASRVKPYAQTTYDIMR